VADAARGPAHGFGFLKSKGCYQQQALKRFQYLCRVIRRLYNRGSLAFAQLYQNLISVYNTELTLQEYLKDFEENWAELEWLVGGELPRRPEGRK
jgi:hypothetical protein